MLRPPPYREAINATEEQCLPLDVKEKGTSYQGKDNLEKVDMSIANENLLKSNEKEESLEHKINEQVTDKKMCQQEHSMNLMDLKVELESLVQESEEELKNITDVFGLFTGQEEAAEYQTLVNELEQLQVKIATQRALNETLRSGSKKTEDNLEHVLKDAKEELDSLTTRNKYLIKDINSERQMSDVLHETVTELEDQCGNMLLMNFLRRNKKKKDKSSSRNCQ
ncbi:uncharacterized protein LOC121904635 isoform X2 [Scomber scombrus]|uniref:Uncharacterized protein LOC121904635 isoform X2 n=1 Tax=Scomber scombrus TaxID=13677 RepID=A0AAV1MUH8_SCOSC